MVAKFAFARQNARTLNALGEAADKTRGIFPLVFADLYID